MRGCVRRSALRPVLRANFKDRPLDYWVTGYGAPAASHPAFQPHPIQGWTPDFIPYVLQPAIDEKLYDALIPVPGPVGIEWSRKLAQREGILTGISGGASFAVAIQVAEKANPGAVILCMLPDTGERYLSSPLFEGIPRG